MTGAISTPRKIGYFILLAAGLLVCGGVVSFGLTWLLIGTGAIGDRDFGALGLAIITLLLGYVLGIVIGLIIIRRALKIPGSLVFGIIGAAGWTVISVIVGAAMGITSDHSILVFLAFFLSVPAVTLAGYFIKS